MLFGSWFATVNALPAAVVDPMAATRTIVRRKPVSRDTMVPAPRSALARPMLLIARTPVRGARPPEEEIRPQPALHPSARHPAPARRREQLQPPSRPLDAACA